MRLPNAGPDRFPDLALQLVKVVGLPFDGQVVCVLGLVRVALPRAHHLSHGEEATQLLVEAGDAIAQNEDRVLLVRSKALVLQVRYLFAAERGKRRKHTHLDATASEREGPVHANAHVELGILKRDRLEPQERAEMIGLLIRVVDEVLSESGFAVLLLDAARRSSRPRPRRCAAHLSGTRTPPRSVLPSWPR